MADSTELKSSNLKEIVFPLPGDDASGPLIPKKENLTKTYLAATAASMYIAVLGMAASFTAPATIDMQSPGSRFIGITLNEITWIASLPTTTSSLGNILSGFLSNKFGRKGAIILTSTPYVLSWLMIVYAPTLSWIYCGRLLIGICFGVSSVAVPAYLVEISTVKNRGIIAASFQLTYTIGVLVMVCLGFGLRWSWMAMIGAITLTLSTCLMFFMPESPHWLLRQSNTQEALKSLQFLRGKDSDFKEELLVITRNQQQIPQTRLSLFDFKNPTFYKPTIISIALQFFQQFAGINVLTSYTVEIFKNSGGNIDAQLSAVIFAAVQVVATIFSTGLMDKLGRRLLFVSSGSLMTVSLAFLGTYNILSEYGLYLNHFKWVPLFSLLLYIVAFSFGFGPCGIVMPPEMVHIQFRSTVLAIAMVSSNIFGFVVTKSFDILINSIGYYGLYFTYGVFALLGTLFGIFCLPETKGRTIEEVNKSFE